DRDIHVGSAQEKPRIGLRRGEVHGSASAAKSLRTRRLFWQESGRRILPRQRRPVHRLLELVDGHFSEERRADVGPFEAWQLQQAPCKRIVVRSCLVYTTDARLERIDSPARGRDE